MHFVLSVSVEDGDSSGQVSQNHFGILLALLSMPIFAGFVEVF
jgi:hypothetical protein